MRVVLYILGLFTAGLMMIATAIPANAIGIDNQMKINTSAVKITDKTCGKWSIKMSNAKKDCRFKSLKKNGYIALYDLSDLPVTSRLTPHAPPVSDTRAV